jgi:hypothetical protein
VPTAPALDQSHCYRPPLQIPVSPPSLALPQDPSAYRRLLLRGVKGASVLDLYVFDSTQWAEMVEQGCFALAPSLSRYARHRSKER